MILAGSNPGDAWRTRTGVGLHGMVAVTTSSICDVPIVR